MLKFMTTINQLASIDTLSTSDQLLIYNTVNGDERRTSLNSLLTFVNENATPQNLNVKQYSSPATGFNIQIGLIGTIQEYSSNIWLILTPAGTLATGTLTLPPSSFLQDQQEILINSTQTITSLSFNLNGVTAGVGLPTTILAGGVFKLRYDQLTNNIYRI